MPNTVERMQSMQPGRGGLRRARAAALLAGTLALPWALGHFVSSPIALTAGPNGVGSSSNHGRAAQTRRSVEVAFVLDTTGSMSGLIEGAKHKIWSIASELVQVEGSANVKIGLVAYRDRGDAYVTQLHDLSDDMDSVYARLQGLIADGGGDDPESVNEALRVAVERMSWSRDPGVYRAIFLVGDAPPHLEDPRDVPYALSAERARAEGILVNAVQCGDDAETQRVWREIAQLSRGEYVAIAQDGAMALAGTPMDAELAALSEQLRQTALLYGTAEDKRELDAKLERAAVAPPAATAARLSYLARTGGRLNSGRADLIDAIGAGEASLEAVPEAELPSELRSLDRDERTRRIEEKRAERARIQAEIERVLAERASHLEQVRRRPGAIQDDRAFDDRVRALVAEQVTRSSGSVSEAARP